MLVFKGQRTEHYGRDAGVN